MSSELLEDTLRRIESQTALDPDANCVMQALHYLERHMGFVFATDLDIARWCHMPPNAVGGILIWLETEGYIVISLDDNQDRMIYLHYPVDWPPNNVT